MFETDSAHIGVTVLGSGSSGNATIVHCGGEGILIDAGFSFREFKRRFQESGLADSVRLRAILVTHEHDDHVKGLRVCADNLELPVFTTRKCADVLRRRDAKIGHFSLIAPGGMFSVGSFSILPFSIPHDAVDPVAFVIRKDEFKIGVATDLGNGNHVVQYELQGCDTLVLESNHDLNLLAASSRPWPLKQRIMGPQGHLSNDASSQLLSKIIASNTRNVILAHISHECNKVEIAEECARKCLCSCDRSDVALSIADQDTPIQTAWL